MSCGSEPSGRPVHRSLKRMAWCLGMLSGLIGAIVFIGWMLGIVPLRDLTGVVTMKTNTALATLLAGAALLLFIPAQARPGRRSAGRVCAAIVMLLGMLTFSEHVIGLNLGIDQLLATEPAGAGATLPLRAYRFHRSGSRSWRDGQWRL
jgi:hypothetical protein